MKWLSVEKKSDSLYTFRKRYQRNADAVSCNYWNATNSYYYHYYIELLCYCVISRHSCVWHPNLRDDFICLH